MTLQFTNTHIYFSIEAIWNNLDYKYRYQLHQQITSNPEDDYVQTLEVPEDILIQIFSTVTVLPEGMAAAINRDMLANLMGQIEPQSNMAAVMSGAEEPNEASRILIAINDIDIANKAVKAAKIESGRNLILA